jgi:hypothetical protein
MATIEIRDGKLVVQMHGWDVVLALRSTLTVPLVEVRAAVVRPPDAHFDNLHGLRVAGGYLPRSFATGYFWVTGVSQHSPQQHALGKLDEALKDLAEARDDAHFRAADVRAHVEAAANGIRASLQSAGASPLSRYLAFYDVHQPDKAIGIDVEHGRLRRIVVEVENETPEAAVARINAARGG